MATDSRSDEFSRAAWILAAIYVILTAVLIVVFSLVLYANVAHNVGSNVEGDFPTDAAQARFVSKTMRSVRDDLVAADVAVLAVVAGVAYVLARLTLRPVRDSVRRERQFLSNASHELRTPLTILTTQLEVAKRGDQLPGDEAEIIDASLDEARRMRRIVEDLLTLSRIDAREEQLLLERVELDVLLARIIERMQVYASRYDVVLESFSQDRATVRADAEKLERAIVNVIKNAIEHSGPGATVSVALLSAPNGWAIQVTDRGEGIDEQDLPHVFERFYRAKGSAFRERGGSGLGLAIAGWIVEEHGGTVQLRSARGQGTTVTLSLPDGGASRSLHRGGLR